MKTLGKTIVYKATTPSNKFYFGITNQGLKERIRLHHKDAKRKNETYCWANALKKYGKNIKWEIVAEFDDRNEALKLEIELIAKYSTQDRDYGYNYTSGGDGFRGASHRPETLTKISDYLKSINHGVKEVEHLHKYYKNNPEKRSELAKQMYVDNPEMRQFMKDKINKQRESGQKLGKPAKPILVIKDCLVLEFESQNEAARFFNVDGSHIHQILKRKNNVYKGYTFVYADSI
jgi:group I intron endonuclease